MKFFKDKEEKTISVEQLSFTNEAMCWDQVEKYLEHSIEAIYILDPKLKKTYVNPAFNALLGEQADQFFNPEEWLSSDELVRVLAFHAQSLEGETVRYDVHGRFGAEIKYFSIMNMTMYHNNTITGIIGVVKDMTASSLLQEEKIRLESNRKAIEGIPGLALFEYNLSDKQFSSFGPLDTMFGLSNQSTEEYTPLIYKQLLHPDDLSRYLEDLGKLMIDSESYTKDSTLRIFHLKEAVYRTFLVRCHISSNRKILTWAVMDQTSQWQDEQSKIKQLSHFVEAVIMEYDFKTESFQYITPGLFEMLGYTTDLPDLTPEFWMSILHPDDIDRLVAAHEEILMGKPTTYCYRVFVNQSMKWVEERREPIFDEQHRVTAYRSFFKDVTRIREQQEKIIELRKFDPITGLANRGTLTEYINELITKHTPITLIGISFNHLMEVKQTLGFEAADEWRAVTTSALQSLVPEQALLGIIVGDTNLIVIPEQWTDEEARAFGKQVTHLSEQPFKVGNYEIYTTVSVGVCRYPSDGETTNDLIKHTINVTNHAYQQGPPHFELYSSKVDLPSIRRYELIKDIRTAIKKHEFFLVYQPKVDAWTGEIIGAEALMRWTHPSWGPVSPIEFIPLVETNNQYIEMTDYLIQEVCAFLGKMEKKIPISINVPVHYFYRDGYLDTIKSELSKWGIHPKFLEIEIPESTLLDNRTRMKMVFQALNSFGLSVSFDDFGKGYSSLAYVQDYNVQTIKIDRLFAHGVHHNVKSQAIVRSLMYIAHEFGMKVVVEGVEQMNDLCWLREHDVKVIQGYLFSQPVSEQALERLLDKKFLSPQDTDHLCNSTSLIPAHMTFSKIRSLEIDLGKAPILIAPIMHGKLLFYTKLFLPPDDFLQFTIQLSDQHTSFTVTLQHMTELENGLYRYEATCPADPKLEQAFKTAHNLASQETWSEQRIRDFLK